MGNGEGMPSFRKNTCQGLSPKPRFSTHVGMTLCSYLKSGPIVPVEDYIGCGQQEVELWGLELYLSRTSGYRVFPERTKNIITDKESLHLLNES